MPTYSSVVTTSYLFIYKIITFTIDDLQSSINSLLFRGRDNVGIDNAIIFQRKEFIFHE